MPDISGATRARVSGDSASVLPNLSSNAISLSVVQPQIQLPHSEPLSEEQKSKAESLIELFSLDIMTCFYSQFWSNRLASIEKVEE